MLKEYKFRTSACIWGGFVFGLFGFLLAVPETSFEAFGRLLAIGGYILISCGCLMYARGKGYGWFVGLVSIFGPIGVVFIYVLRDRSGLMMKKRKKEEEQNG